MNIRRSIAQFAALFMLCTTTVWAQSLSVDQIVAMNEAGIGDEAVIAKIKADGTPFDLSPDEMVALRKRGLSSAVIAAMLGNKPAAAPMSLDSPDPAVPHPAGLYFLSGTGGALRMIRMDATMSSQAKTGGIIGYALTSGIASMSIKVVIQKDAAAIRTGASPRFYFFFEQPSAATATNTWANGMNTVVASPSEFTLTRLTRKDGRREARVGSTNIAGMKTGVMDKDRIAFTQRLVSPGVYEVTMPQPLATGEYGFVYSLSGGGTQGATTARIFDFGVDG